MFTPFSYFVIKLIKQSIKSKPMASSQTRMEVTACDDDDDNDDDFDDDDYDYHDGDDNDISIMHVVVCRVPIALPPYGKVTASSEKSPEGASSCQANDAY